MMETVNKIHPLSEENLGQMPMKLIHVKLMSWVHVLSCYSLLLVSVQIPDYPEFFVRVIFRQCFERKPF